MERSGVKTGSGRGISPSVPPQKCNPAETGTVSLREAKNSQKLPQPPPLLIAAKRRKIRKNSLYLGPFFGPRITLIVVPVNRQLATVNLPSPRPQLKANVEYRTPNSECQSGLALAFFTSTFDIRYSAVRYSLFSSVNVRLLTVRLISTSCRAR